MARRIFCILLAVLLAVPFAAFAVVNAATVKVYTRWDASAEPFELTEGVDFTWTYADAAQSGIALQFPQGSQANLSQLRVEIDDGSGRKYAFFDTLNGSDWVDMSRAAQGEQASFSLVDADTLAYVDGATLAVSSAQGADNNNPDLIVGGDSGIGGGVEVIGPSLTPTMPDRETDYGFLLDGGYLYSAPGGAQTVQVTDEDVIQYDGSDPVVGPDGRTWVSVKLGDQTGYVAVDEITFMTQGDYDAWQQSISQPTLAPQEQMPAHETNFVRLRQGGAVYTSPDGQTAIALDANAVLEYDGDSQINEGGYLWIPVRYEGGIGYVRALHDVDFMTGAEYQQYLDSQRQQMPAHETNFARVGDGAALYDNSGNVIGQLSGSAPVEFDGQTTLYDGEGKLWIRVLQGEQSGFVRVDDVQFMTGAEYQQYLDSQKKPLPARETNFAWAANGTALLDGSLQPTGASLSGAKPLEYDGSDPVYDAEGNPYIRVTQDGQSGYVSAYGMSFMTQQSYNEYLESLKEKLPDHETDYLRVSTGTALYTEPGGSQTYGLAQDSVVQYTGAYKNDENGALWCQVRTENGQIGYVPMAAMSFMTSAEYQRYVESQATPTPVPTPEPTLVPTPEPTLVPTAEPTLLPTPEPTLVPTPDPTLVPTQVPTPIPTAVPTTAPTQVPTLAPTAPAVQGYAAITQNRTGVYSQPAGASFMQLNATDVVYVQYAQLDIYNNVWYYCKVSDTQYGWISAGTARMMSADEVEAYLRQQQTVQNPVTGYKKITVPQGSSLPLLSWADYGAPYTKLLTSGTVVYTYDQVYDQSGKNKLDYVRLSDGSTGYISSNYATAMTQQEIASYLNGRQQIIPTAAPTIPPTSNFSGYAQVSTQSGGTVNFRTAPSMSGSSVIARLNNRSLVRVMGETSTSDGYTWYQCESNGKAGYVRGDFLNLLSVADYTYILQTGSYTTNTATVKVTATASSVSSTKWQTPRPTATQGTPMDIKFSTPTATERTIPTPMPTASPTATATLTPTFAPLNTPDPSASATAGTPGFGVVITASPSVSPTATAPAAFPTEESKGFSASGLIIALVVLLLLAAGGFYGYSVYNKARRKQAEERARRMAAEKRREQEQARPAVRRPAPPTEAPAAQRPRPQQPGDARPTANSASAMYRQEMEAGRQAQQRSPYARPESPTGYERPVQNVNSTMPRATVDGRSVGDARTAPESETYRARTMPVAPPPTTENDGTPTPRRRRAANHENNIEG